MSDKCLKGKVQVLNAYSTRTIPAEGTECANAEARGNWAH